MSHYIVMAIQRDGENKSVDELMAPYDENLDVEPYVRWTKADLLEIERDRCLACQKGLKVAEEVGWDEEEYGKRSLTENLPSIPWLKAVRDRYAQIADATDEELWPLIQKSYADRLDADGNYVSTRNPMARWDYWGEGCGESLSPKEGADPEEWDYDSAIARAIDWDETLTPTPTRRDKIRAGRLWDAIVLGKYPDGVVDKVAWLSEEYGPFAQSRTPEELKAIGKTRKEFVKAQTDFSWVPYAVVDSDGWHAPGKVGWFGTSDEAPGAWSAWKENFRRDWIDTLAPHDRVTLLDCHI